MTWLIAVLYVLSGAEPEHGIATNFGGSADKWRGGESPCIGRRIERTDHGIAHRTLPCGAKVIVINPRTRRAVETVVLDRGPYGATLPHGIQPPDGQPCRRRRKSGRCWYVKKRASWPGQWRGLGDLTYALAEELGHNGYEPVVIIRTGRAK